MADGSGVASARYRAFISYSHRDAVFAARLHRRLEGYVLPKRLGAGRRLTPVFKDREELPAAHDLSAQVRAALAMSDCLIVVCSPDAAASPWVGREIALFRELHPDRPILAALARGEPAEAFPAALAGGGVEPLAADFRKTADGERLALLKLVAGVAGVGVDQLVQRDAQRRLRGVMAVTAGAVALAIVMGLTTAFALNARAEAERQRAAAESLVEFMLGDLRQQLKGVGRISVLNSVNYRVLSYYDSQTLSELPDDSLRHRSSLLLAMGEDEVGQNNLHKAASHFKQAYRDTAALLEKSPHDPNRLFAHAQSSYWRGYIEYRALHTTTARGLFLEYLRLAERLSAAEPASPRSFQEIGYANSNLCSLEIEQGNDARQALKHCASALDNTRIALKLSPNDINIKFDMTTRLGWLSETQLKLGNFDQAKKNRLEQKLILIDLLYIDPENAIYRDAWGACHRGLSVIYYKNNEIEKALDSLQVSRQTFEDLSKIDPTNARWADQLNYAKRTIHSIKNTLN